MNSRSTPKSPTLVPLAKPNPDVIRITEHLCRRAKTGELRNLAYVAETGGARFHMEYTRSVNLSVLIGLLEQLKFSLLRDIDEEKEPLE